MSTDWFDGLHLSINPLTKTISLWDRPGAPKGETYLHLPLTLEQKEAIHAALHARDVVIEVSGGVASVTRQPADVNVRIIDHDNVED